MDILDEDDIWKELEKIKVEDEDTSTISCPNTTSQYDEKYVCVHVCENCGVDIDMRWVEDGDCVCRQCNTIQSRLIDTNAEWRYYGNEDNKNSNPTRVGTPTNIFIPKSSLGTVIGTENVRKNGYEFQRIRRYQMFQSMPYKERSLLHVMESLNVNASNNGIPSSIIEDAKMMYKKISEQKISRGDNRNGLIA